MWAISTPVGREIGRWLGVLVTICCLSCPNVTYGYEIYISPTGSDASPGTKDQPLRTLEAARDLARQYAGKETVIVTLMPGRYFLDHTFELDERDSGSPEHPVIYRASKAHQSVIDGGMIIDPAHVSSAEAESEVLKYLAPDVRDRIRVIDLHALGISDFGRIGPRGFARGVWPAPLELFVNGQPMKLSRWPNDNEPGILMGKVIDKGSVPRFGDTSNRGAVFEYEVDRAKRWKDEKEWYIEGHFNNGFADDLLPVEKLDLENGTIKTALPHLYGFVRRDFTRWRALNLLVEMDQPGEYYIDREAGRLYFFPPDGVNPSDALIQVSLTEEPLFAIENASHLCIEGLVFENARGTGIYMERGTGNTIRGCLFRNLGILAVQMGQGATSPPGGMYTHGMPDFQSVPAPRIYGAKANYGYLHTAWNRLAGTHHTIIDCTIYDTGAGGILLGGGDRRTLVPGNNVVENCDISRVNRWDKKYKPPVLITGVGNVIRNCHLYDCDGQAILMYGNDHLIEFNEIDHVLKNMSDQGAIYAGRNPSETGSIIRYNFFHDIYNQHEKSHGVQAIFFDDCSLNTATIWGNVFYKAGSTGVVKFFRGGGSHIVNNIVIDCPPLLQLQGSGGRGGPKAKYGNTELIYEFMHKQNPDPTDTSLGHRRLFEDVDVSKPPYRTRYPWIMDVYGGGKVYTHTDRNYIVQGDYSQFVDPDNLNFQLKENSSVYEQIPGFEIIPFDKIGLYPPGQSPHPVPED
ncbi:MAG: right-handed parallel beta-helix repeat-containing protein [Gammaproteobacteria bacterium]|nr:MAG: right-handed parallel beta-helix repeat-containing protein [Gammaproteobacteria bacterium]